MKKAQVITLTPVSLDLTKYTTKFTVQWLQHIAYNHSYCRSLHRKWSNLAGSISLGNLKQKCEQHSLFISLSEVRNSFMSRRATVKCNDRRSDLFSGQTSKQ